MIKNNNVIIKNNTLYFQGKEAQINSNLIKTQIEAVKYPRRIELWSVDSLAYNPIEADRENSYDLINGNSKWDINAFYHYNGKISINIPSFNEVFWYLFCQTPDAVPSFEQFAKMYLNTHFTSSKNQKNQHNNSIMFRNGKCHIYNSVGDYITIINSNYNCENNNTNNECVFQNKLINFRDNSSHNLPINQLTTEQILRRLTKVYGSLIRDLYHPIIFNSLGAETEYNSNLDTHGGIDLIVNGYVCCSYMGNKSSMNFANDKQRFRHNENVLQDDEGNCRGFKLITNFNTDDKGKLVDTIFLPNDDIIKKIINDINAGKIQEEYFY